MHRLVGLLPSHAGRQLERERRHLLSLRRQDVSLALVLGGAKIQQKLRAVTELQGEPDVLCLGGMMAIAVALVLECPTGAADFPDSAVAVVNRCWNAMAERRIQPLVPIDWVVRGRSGSVRLVDPRDVARLDTIIDVGPQTVQEFLEHLRGATAIFWNGPFGAYEHSPGEKGSVCFAAGLRRRRQCGATVIADGGDTLSLVGAAGLSDAFNILSCGGGAALAFLARGDDLPGLVHLIPR